MKKLLPAFMLSLAACAAVGAEYTVDPVHSLVIYRIQHMGIAPSYGVFTGISGGFSFDPEKPGDSAMEIRVATDSINSFNTARDEHLKNPDFFDTARHPEMKFTSKSWKKTGDKTHEVTGELTLLGVTREVVVRAVFGGTAKGMRGEQRAGFEAELTIKRSDFGMAKYLPDAIGDEVRLTIGIEGEAAAPAAK